MTYEFLRIYSDFNNRFFHGLLDNPIFEINPKRKGLFCFDYENPRTIIIGSDFAKATKIQIIFDEILHCMIHMYNYRNGIIDRTKNHYHKQEFANVALSIGLYVSKLGSRGWAFISSCKSEIEGRDNCQFPRPEYRQKLLKIYKSTKVKKESFLEIQKELIKNCSSKRVFLLKYYCKCPTPHNTVRSGRRPNGKNGLDITCNNCNTKFICEKVSNDTSK